MDGKQFGGEHTLVSLFQRRVARSGSRTALHFRGSERPESLDWNQLDRLVRRVAGNLIGIGLRPGDRVALVSENRWEWLVCDLAVLAAGAVHVPIHVSLAAAQIAEQLCASGARVVIFSHASLAEQLLPLADRSAQPPRCYAFDAGSTSETLSWTELLDPRGEDQALPAVNDPDRPATILYTSGTTGAPRGVTLTHRNLVFNAVATESRNRERVEDLRLNVLPLSHIFARTCDVYTWLAGESELALAGSRETLLEDLSNWRPTSFNAVPLVYERLMRAVQQRGEADRPAALRELMGGRIRMCCAGGAALPGEVYDFYLAHGLPLLQGYGLTETSPVISLSTLDAYRRDSIGRPLPGIEVRLSDHGEILTRGPHVMRGYDGCAEETGRVIRDGWFHTGDVGRWDDDGFLYLSGRLDDLIVTTGGKNVAPAPLEALLESDPLIDRACVVGDRRDYLAALIVPDRERLAARFLANYSEPLDPDADLSDPRVTALYDTCLRSVLADRAAHEQIRRFGLLPRPFSLEQGELTAKGTLRRPAIQDHFSELIEAMYAG